MGRRIGRWLGFLALVGVIVTILLSFHQPPMRLMPTPLAFRKSGSALFAANPYLRQDNRIELFYATNRLPVGPRNDRLYAVTPGRNLNLGVTTVRIGGAGTTWDKVYEWSMGLAQDERRPQLILEAMTELGVLDDAERPEDGPPLPAGMRAWLGLVDEAVARSPDHDIIIYVHGANSTVERAAGQAAQLRHFTGQNSVVLLFAWPTAEIGAMGLEGAVRLGFAKELGAIEDPAAREERFEELVAQQYEQGKALNAARLDEIDEIIHPAETRERILQLIGGFPGERSTRPHIDTW